MANYYTPFSLRISEELLAKLKVIAVRNKRSANKEMEYALTRLYEKHVPLTVRDFLETKATLEAAKDGQPPPAQG